MPAALDVGERRLVDAVAARSDDLVALLCDLIGFDTTSRAAPGAPAREEAALQQHLGGRLRGAGAEVDVWEPAPEDVAGHPCARRAASASRVGRSSWPASRGAGGGRSLLLNGHIDVVTARREDGWEHDPFDPQVRDGRVTGRGTCDMKGGIAAMVVAAEALAAAGALRGDVLVCTNTDEESSGVGGLACARHGLARRLRDRARADRPRGLAGLPRLRLLRGQRRRARGPHRAGARELAEGGAVNAIEKARHLLDGVERLRTRLAQPARARATTCSTRPTSCEPARGRRRLVRHDPQPRRAHARRADPARRRPTRTAGRATCATEVEGFLRRWCDADPWLAAAPADVRLAHRGQPVGDAGDAASVRALLGANEALGLPARWAGSDSWYDGATFALEAGTPALMYGPRTSTGRTRWASGCRSTTSSLRPGDRARRLAALPLIRPAANAASTLVQAGEQVGEPPLAGLRALGFGDAAGKLLAARVRERIEGDLGCRVVSERGGECLGQLDRPRLVVERQLDVDRVAGLDATRSTLLLVEADKSLASAAPDATAERAR